MISSRSYSSGQCRCGAVSIAIDMKPFLNYNCHCSHCRGFASRCQPQRDDTDATDDKEGVLYHGGGAVWKWNVQFLNGSDNNIEYEGSSSLGGLFAMQRGKCRICRQAIWESGQRLIFPLAMVMAAPLLPGICPDTDIFYDSGYQKGTTGTKVLQTDLGSLTYEIFLLVVKAIPSIPWSLYKRFTRTTARRATETNKVE